MKSYGREHVAEVLYDRTGTEGRRNEDFSLKLIFVKSDRTRVQPKTSK